MARAKAATAPKGKPDGPTEVVVKYDLFDLPTAFHKAGLAAMVMLIESLKARRKLAVHETNHAFTPTTVEIAFTESLIQKLMDDLYDAQLKEVVVKSRWQGAEVARPPTDAEKEAGTPFVYRVIQPTGRFLRESYPDEDGLWLKLWRDMLWSIPRGRPTTREPYNQRTEGKLCKEGPNAWAHLLKVQKARAKSGFWTAEVSSALLPGAQAVNAEAVPFEGRAEHNLLLHFWPLAVLLFVPQRVETDGSTDFAGYTLAVPEVSNLADFIHDYPNLLHSLSTTARGYRPAQAVVDLPAEGALAFLDRLAMITGQQVESVELHYSIGGVEYLHLVKEGNNIKTMASGRVSPNKKLLAGYRQIVAPKDESISFRNPLFRRGLLIALLQDEPWYAPFGRTLATFDAELFIRQPRRTAESEERGPPQFANDAAKKFQYETKLFTQILERSENMPEAQRPKAPLSVIINRVVRNYLLARTSEKTGIKLDQFASDDKIDWSKVPGDFNEAKQKLAQSLFLEFRSRKNQAFVDHFAATFFSVTQRLNDKDRQELAEALIDTENADRRDDLKTLTLLSLSANS